MCNLPSFSVFGSHDEVLLKCYKTLLFMSTNPKRSNYSRSYGITLDHFI